VTPERLASLIATRGISIGDVPGGGKPEWTSQEAAIALAGMPRATRDRSYAAFVYRWAGDEGQRSVLYGFLMTEALNIAQDEHWPSRIREQRYVERLVRLAVLEERFWWIITKNQLWPEIMRQDGFEHMDERLWFTKLSKKYEAIRHVIETWCADAHYHMLKSIKAE
jgi:hypothetical protein